MEEVLKVEYDKSSFPGKYITEEERVKNNLKKDVFFFYVTLFMLTNIRELSLKILM